MYIFIKGELKDTLLNQEIKENSTDSAIRRLEELFGPLPLWTPKKIRNILYKFQYNNNTDLSFIPDDLFFYC